MKKNYEWGEIKEEDILRVTDENGEVHEVFKVEGGDNWSLEFPKFGIAPDPRINFPKIKNMDVRNDDVFICAYPKAGTHWVWEISKMLTRGKPEYDPLPKESSMLEFHYPEEFEEMTSPRVLNTHLWYKHLPKKAIEKSSKVIFIQRNPKDVIVSYYHHKKAFYSNYPYTFEQFIHQFQTQSELLHNWFSYTLDWEKNIELKKSSIFPLYYEDIKDDPVREITKIAKYLEVNYEEKLIEDIAERCNFQNMKKANDEVKVDMHAPKGSDEKKSRFMYRKGQVGDWKNYFTVAQSETFDEYFRKWMSGSKFSYRYSL